MRRYLAGQRGERARLDDLIRATPRDSPTEEETGVYEFGAPNRTEEIIAADQKQAEDARAKTNGVTFVTLPWIWAMREHQWLTFAELALDAVNFALDPAKPEDLEEESPLVGREAAIKDGLARRSKPRGPVWLHRVGVAGSNPLPIASQIAETLRRR